MLSTLRTVFRMDHGQQASCLLNPPPPLWLPTERDQEGQA